MVSTGAILVREVVVRAAGGTVGTNGQTVELHAVDLTVCSAWILDPVWLFDGTRPCATSHFPAITAPLPDTATCCGSNLRVEPQRVRRAVCCSGEASEANVSV
jgi:hypothetical protein